MERGDSRVAAAVADYGGYVASETVAGMPAPPLRGVIRSYRGYRSLGGPAVHRGLPSGALTFIISLDDPVDIVAMPLGLQGPGRFQAFVGGLHATPAYIRQHGSQIGVSLDLTPPACRRLLGVPAGELANAVVHLGDLAGSAADSLVDRLADGPGWPDRFEVLDEVLMGWLQGRREPPAPPAAVSRAWEMLVTSAGSLGVTALATAVGYSRRHLSESFHRELGLAPKSAAKVLRFTRSRRLISRPEGQSLAAVAAAAGYFDQSHMDRDWTEIAGCTPSVWMAEELPFVQDDGVHVGACSGRDDDDHESHRLAGPSLS